MATPARIGTFVKARGFTSKLLMEDEPCQLLAIPVTWSRTALGPASMWFWPLSLLLLFSCSPTHSLATHPKMRRTHPILRSRTHSRKSAKSMTHVEVPNTSDHRNSPRTHQGRTQLVSWRACAR